jgi:transcriptional regulator with XRE-family HTH domain
MNPSCFNSNIKFLRQRKKRTQDEMAVALDMKRSTLSGYENGVAQPSLEVLLIMSQYFKISIDTLIKVDLSILSERQLLELELGFDSFIVGSNLRVLSTTVDNNNRENVELVHEKAKAGYTNGYADPDYVSALPAFHLPFLAKERKYRCFQITGDSMMPIPDKSYVTGEFLQDWRDIKTGTAFILLTRDEGIVFKIVENRMKENRTLLLRSLNPDYAPYEISIVDIKEVWRFVNFIQTELPEPQMDRGDIVNHLMKLSEEVHKIKKAVKM